MQKIILVFLTIFSMTAHAKNIFNAEQLEELAQNFVQAIDARQQPKTTIADIDNYLSLLADDFIDEHIKFKFTYTDKVKLKEDMIAKMAGEIIYSSIKIDEMIVGGNAAFIKMTETIKGKPAHLDKVIEYSVTNVVTLEFNDKGLITHIRRHHG
ncbi:nuclear transport factor 2 family protein [Thalassotalea fonticola]|uniref:Nuclear transport factor 2 family protein n=1 Tax=Thalassotalea fonticola TaxID=3065649 RepID=A0ABZ0GJI9_9GAMM|nr:nuclear transport factor 2 family protein [Colwelliaceae bacterium S1-1]